MTILKLAAVVTAESIPAVLAFVAGAANGGVAGDQRALAGRTEQARGRWFRTGRDAGLGHLRETPDGISGQEAERPLVGDVIVLVPLVSVTPVNHTRVHSRQWKASVLFIRLVNGSQRAPSSPQDGQGGATGVSFGTATSC